MHIKLIFASLTVLFLIDRGFSQDLPTPKGWQVEKFALPPQFANTIPVNGTEDIRFSPEWAKKHTDGYWTYCFLWTINSNQTFTTSDFEQYLHDYYTGLIRNNLIKAKIDTAIATPVKVKLHKIEVDKTDKQAFEGVVDMLDYITQDPIKLNFRIHIKKQTPGNKGTTIFFEASPQPYNHKVWLEMNNINDQLISYWRKTD